ncbi:MAG: tetratricopeptide repeat protein [Deltaproteobacteria bacterium]|nr:tetratricopeptide repeat protein [Deltaproteobacteria bacterium]
MSKFSTVLRKAYRERDWDKTIKYGEQALRQDPKDIKVLNDLACAYFNKRDYDRSLAICETIYEIAPPDDLSRQAKELGIRYMRHHEVLGEIYYLKGRDQDALRTFERLKTLGNVFSKKYSLSAKIHIKQGDLDSAVREYHDMAINCPRHLNEAANGLLDLVEKDPLHDACYETLFRIYTESKQLQSIVSGYEALRSTGKAKEKFLFTLINMYRLAGEGKKGLAVIREEIRRRPGNPNLYIYLGRAYQAISDFSQAKTCIEKAISLDPQNAQRYRQIYDAMLQHLQKDEERLKQAVGGHLKANRCMEAIAACEKLLKIRPGDEKYRLVLYKVIEKSIHIYLKEGKTDAAVPLIDRLDAFTDFVPDVQERILDLKRKLSDSLIHVYENRIAKNEISGDELDRIRCELAEIYFDQKKDPDRAQTLLEEVTRGSGPYENRARYTLAIHLLRAKKLETAETHVQKFAAGPCSDETVASQMYDLGVVCEEVGLKHQARTLFTKILAKDKTYRDVAQRMETLQQRSGGTEIAEAILVVDICASSRIMSVYGDEATYQIKNALEGIMFPVFRDCESSFVKSTGDGFLVTFPHSSQAVNAAARILDAAKKYNENLMEGPEIHLRFGIHFGAVRVRPDKDRHGTNVNVPFRVEGLKAKDLIEVEGGILREDFPPEDRILTTEAVRHEISGDGRFKIRYIGLFELRNITGIHKIYQVLTDT